MTDLPVRWRKSSRSSGNNGACVEVAEHGAGVRDSKNPSAVLGVGTRALIESVKTDRLR